MQNKYRFQQRSLYKYNGRDYVHCAKVPAGISSLEEAIEWYESAEEERNERTEYPEYD